MNSTEYTPGIITRSASTGKVTLIGAFLGGGYTLTIRKDHAVWAGPDGAARIIDFTEVA